MELCTVDLVKNVDPCIRRNEMILVRIEKGDHYEAAETDLRAILNSKIGDKFLDKDNCFKTNAEIVIIRKRKGWR